MILDAPFPPDIRVEKEARALGAAGHEVFVMCQHRQSFPRKEKREPYTIIRFSSKEYPLLRRLTVDFRKITFWDLVWKKGIDRFVRGHHIDVLHVHDLPLVKSACTVAKKHHLPIVADYHENFPAHVQALSETNASWKRKFYQSYRRWVKYEESISRKVNAIIVVAEEYKQHLITEHRIPPEKIIIVQNTIDPSQIEPNMNTNKKSSSSPEFVISYIGSYGPHRGLDVVIQAMPEILSHIPQATLVIAGRGKNKPDLRNLTQKLNIENSVRFLDWMDYKNIGREFQRASVGVIPHHPSEHTDTTIPNKLFEYMYFKTPVIVSDRPPLKRIVEETGAGKVFEAGNAQDFAQAVLEIHNHPGDFGEKGNKAIMEKYNWNVDGGHLVELYESLESKV